jgi:hypothetical protein
MAELVRDGVDGLRFHVGDAGDLRRVLETVIERPAMLAESPIYTPRYCTCWDLITKDCRTSTRDWISA